MRPRTLLALVVLSQAIITNAQGPNPLYLREMPNEDRVVRQMQGTDPIDSIARQAGAYEQLRTIITDLASAQNRDSSHLLPDEKRIADYYEVAAARGWQRVQAAVGTDRKRYSRLTAYSIDPDFKAEVLAKFFTPNFRNVYAKAQEYLKDRHKQIPNDQPMPAPASGGATDPGTLAMRRCVAAGRDPMQCFGEVFQSGMQMMAGGQAGMGSAFGPILPAGLRMTGIYGDGHFFLSFTEDTLWITCNHVSTQASYAVAMNNGQVVLTTTPGPEGAKLGNKILRLGLTPEGNIVGSGNVQITGMVPAPGQHPVANQTQRRYIPEEEARNPPPWENPQRDAGGNPYVDEPTSIGGRTVSKTSACQMFTARPLGSVGPTHATQSLNPLFGSMTAGAPWGQRSAKDKAWPGPGLRLYGEYDGQGGLILEFHEDSVVVGCRQTFLASNYSIRSANNQWIISVDNGGSPITLALGQDRSISGSGPIRVTGHAFVGDRNNGNGPMFTPATATCASGTLHPAK